MKISYHLFLTIEIVMILFIYDKTLDGLLTALFDAYNRKTFPDVLLSKGDTLPLFYDDIFTVITDEEKAGRVWRGLQKKISASALSAILMVLAFRVTGSRYAFVPIHPKGH